MAEAQIQEGSAGKYAIYGEIAAGGMATVHVGRLLGPRGFARTVAIKRLHAQFARQPDFVAMFLDEAHLVARIRHPNVVPTLDIVATGDHLMLIMEYVSGESLARLWRAALATQRIPTNIASAVAVGMLHGLHAAHEAKNEFGEPLDIVHRDVSPQNVLVGTDGVARVIDFGVAKAIGRLQDAGGEQLKGKVPYMAPEQMRGAPVTRKSDVFAASVVLWEALTMKRLFAADNEAATMQKVLTMPVPAPSSIEPSLPPALDEVLRKGLEREPTRRWATARDMALALELALPPALPSEVGSWVEAMAKEALDTRAGRVADMEISSSGGKSEALEIIKSSEFIADTLWRDLDKSRGSKPDVSLEPLRREAPRGAPAKDWHEADPSELKTSVYVPPPRAPSRSSPSLPEPPQARASQPRTSQPSIELAHVPRSRARQEPPEERARRPLLGRVLGVGAVLALALVVTGTVVLPRYVRGRAIEAAAARGIALSIDDVAIGTDAVRLVGVTITSADVPGVKATATELVIELAVLEPKQATLRGATVTIEGSAADVLASFDRLRASWPAAATRAGGGGAALRVLVPSAHVTWNGVLGPGSSLGVADGSLNLAPHASSRLGDELHFTTQNLAVTTRAGALGPWRVDLDKDMSSTRVRLAFDPPVPDGPNVLVVSGSEGELHIDGAIPRSPLYRIGLSAPIASLVPGAPSQLEAQLHYARMAGRLEANATVTLVGAKVPDLPAPVDVTMSGAVVGDARGPLDLRGGTLSAGPFKATVMGPVTIDDALRASLVWKALPVPCAQLAPPGIKKATDDLATQLGQLTALGGGDLKQQLADLGIDPSMVTAAAPRVSGTLQAAGTLTIDTADPSKCAFTVKPKNNCGLSFFKGQ